MNWLRPSTSCLITYLNIVKYKCLRFSFLTRDVLLVSHDHLICTFLKHQFHATYKNIIYVMTMLPFIVGNWKANVNLDVLEDIKYDPDVLEVAIACPNLYFDDVRSRINDYVKVCGQDCSKFGEGAYTGESPAQFLKNKGIEYVIIGHSERRKYFNEDSDVLALKVQHALQAKLNIIFCIGEDRADREGKIYLNVLYNQFFSVVGKDITITIAYEPVWSIGTGILLDPHELQEIIKHIRKWADSINVKVRVLYGGSVKRSTIKDFRDVQGLDGYLVGGSSLTNELIQIISDYEDLKKESSEVRTSLED